MPLTSPRSSPGRARSSHSSSTRLSPTATTTSSAGTQKAPGRLRSRSSAATAICPALRVRSSAGSSLLKKSVRATTSTSRATSTTSTMTTVAGESRNCTNSSDPAAVRLQKPVTAGPPIGGRSTASGRPCSSCHVDRVRPLRLGVRPGRPVVERRRLLAPAPGEGQPGEVRRTPSRGGRRPSGAAPSRAPGCCRSRSRRRRSSRTTAPACSTPRATPAPGRRRRGRRPCAPSGRSTSAVSEPSCCANARLVGVVVSACSTEGASISSWTISQSPSCLSFQSLKTQKNQYCSTTVPGGPDPSSRVRRPVASPAARDLREPGVVVAAGRERVAGQVEVPAVALAREVARPSAPRS